MCTNSNGSNALHIAAKWGNIPTILALIELKYPVHIEKKNGITALGIAAFKGNLKIIKLLHLAGADANVKSRKGVSPLSLAIKSWDIKCIQYLLEVTVIENHDCESSPLFISIKMGGIMIFKLIYESVGSNVDLNILRTLNGFSPLTYAAYCKQQQIVSYLSLRVIDLN